MKANQVQVGAHYKAKVNGKLVTVKVLGTRVSSATGKTYWDVLNTATGRKTIFRSAQKFHPFTEAPPMEPRGGWSGR